MHKFQYVVKCSSHGYVPLDHDEYIRQLRLPDSKWECPICRHTAQWCDDSLETNPAPSEEDKAIEMIKANPRLMEIVDNVDGKFPSLDEHVHDVASGLGSDANNSGRIHQVAFLLSYRMTENEIIELSQKNEKS